jgi:proton glutamate symport protein
MLKFFTSAIPSNIFQALAEAKFLQIVLFGLIFGLALGALYRRDGVDRASFLKSYLPAFEWINDKVIFFLPIGLFLLIVTQVNQMEPSTFLSLLKLTVAIILSMMIVIVISLLIIAHNAKTSMKKVLHHLSYVCLVAVSTRSTFACVPKAIEAMSQNLNFDKTMSSLVISFGSATCRYGTICFYCVAAIFVANIFDVPLGFNSYMTIFIASILTSIASSGAVGVVSLQMLSLVLEPLGLPLGAVLVLLIAIDPIIDMFDTLASVLGNCAVASSCSPLVEDFGIFQ